MTLSFKSFFLFWLKIGFINFGGPAGQIALMHRELVERKRWMREPQFLHALNYCMMLPGPEAQQLATYSGWLLFKARGALVAGLLFILPSFFILVGLSYVYLRFGALPRVEGFFFGIKASVVALVLEALIRLSKKSLKNNLFRLVALASFLALWLFHCPFPLLIFTAALLGWVGALKWPQYFPVIQEKGFDEMDRGLWRRFAGLLLVFVLLWVLPYLMLSQSASGGLYRQMALFFTKMAFITFGGAYAVLPYMADMGVNHYGWLNSVQMVTGLGLAESTPGPLIMVVTYVGFVTAYLHSLPMHSFFEGFKGALVSTYFTFLPSFLLILLGAPLVEGLRQKPKLAGMLAMISAAVVGVVANLALFFGRTVLFPMGFGVSPDWMAVAFAALSFFLLWRLEWSAARVVVLMGCLGALAAF